MLQHLSAVQKEQYYLLICNIALISLIDCKVKHALITTFAQLSIIIKT